MSKVVNILIIFFGFISVPVAVLGYTILQFSKVIKFPAIFLLGVGLTLLYMLYVSDKGVIYLPIQEQSKIIDLVLKGNIYKVFDVINWQVSVAYGIVLGSLCGLDLYIFPSRPDKSIVKEHEINIQIDQRTSNNGSLIGRDLISDDLVYLTDKDANLHTLCIGTTGSGKTTGISNIIESCINRDVPLFYVDGKGDTSLAKRIEKYCIEIEKPFYLFSMVGDSVKYNPIHTGGITSKKDRIVELREWSEDHYRKIAEGYLQTVFKVLEKAGEKTDLFTLAKYMEQDNLYLIARKLKDKSLISEIDGLSSKRKNIESLISEVENIANSEIGHLFDCSEGNVLTLNKALKEKAVVYFSLQPLAFPSYANTLGKLIINDIKALAASQLNSNTTLTIYTIFDEFSVFAGDQIINLINQGRSAGIHAVLSTQSLSDLSKEGGDSLVGQVLNNCNNYIIQRQNNPDDAEILAGIIGTKDSFEITSQISNDLLDLRGSSRLVKEYIIHPDQLKRLSLGEAIFVNKADFKVRQVFLNTGGI